MNPTPDLIVDLFAGPGGWSEALRRHWPHLHELEVGFEWSAPACATRAAAGHLTIRADVAAVPLEPMRGRVFGLIASPPCQTFSAAGGGAGREHLDALIEHAHAGKLYEAPDPRTGLVLEPLRWIRELRPRWIALEQVPALLPVWHAYEHHLRGLGYSTWSGKLNAANYGVPQTRERAILIASLDHEVSRPEPTHEKNPDGLFALAPWVTMADALGWPEEWATGQETIRGEGITRSWTIDMRLSSPDGNLIPRRVITSDEPSPTITSNTGSSWNLHPGDDAYRAQAEREERLGRPRPRPRLIPGSHERATVRSIDEPAPTVAFGRDSGQWRFEQDPDAELDHEDETDEETEAETHRATVPADRWIRGEARDPEWPASRPSTTIAGDPRDPQPGHKRDEANPDSPGRLEGAIKLTPRDALILQDFPPDYPVSGSRSAQFLQIGNAIPPGMAAAALRKVLR